MNKIRLARLADEMRRVLADIIANEMNDPRIPAMTSITEVMPSADLSQAKCYVAIMGDDKSRDEAIRALIRARGFIRRELARRIQIRTVPELHFFSDNTLDKALHIDKVIDELSKENK